MEGEDLDNHPMMKRLIEELDLIPVQTPSEATAERMIQAMERLRALPALKGWWEKNAPAIKRLAEPDRARVKAAKDKLKERLK